MFLRVAYFGYSTRMLKELCKSSVFKLKIVLYVPKHVDSEFLITLSEYGIQGIATDRKPNFEEIFSSVENIDVFFMYKFEYIIPRKFIKRHKIINFHGGDLRTNRGAHAVVWSILLGDITTCLSVYRLIGGIDEGYLIDEYWVDIDDNDNVETLNNKLQNGIPHLLSSVYFFLCGKIKAHLILGGDYRPKITENDFTIDVTNDSISMIKRKINSQISYYGAVIFIDGLKYRVFNFEEEESVSHINEKIEFANKMLTVEKSGKRIMLKCHI